MLTTNPYELFSPESRILLYSALTQHKCKMCIDRDLAAAKGLSDKESATLQEMYAKEIAGTEKHMQLCSQAVAKPSPDQTFII